YAAGLDCRDYPAAAFPNSILCFLIALIDRNVMARVVAEIDLAGPRDLLLRVEEHLFPLGDPTGSARNSEQHGEHGHWEAHRLINEAGVEVHVGIELALDEVIILEGDAFALQSNFEQGILAHKLEHFISDVLDDAGARIIIFVNAMAESYELHFTGFDALNEFGNFLNRADLHQHAQNFFVRTAVQRAVQGGDRGGGSGVRIDVRAANAADGVGGAVLRVVGLRAEKSVER